MTGIIPELGELRPNPDWARLPLFAEKRWKVRWSLVSVLVEVRRKVRRKF
ncbi:MAG TPA: hypothetical protein VLB04_10445 [Methanotrichaceae archaeon]|nr:hypothetical protein [Methanotrichaceae archaeon]